MQRYIDKMKKCNVDSMVCKVIVQYHYVCIHWPVHEIRLAAKDSSPERKDQVLKIFVKVAMGIDKDTIIKICHSH